jgi:3'(2'), 5'-bisphosphate nucleotidase
MFFNASNRFSAKILLMHELFSPASIFYIFTATISIIMMDKEAIIRLARDAGDRIMEIYDEGNIGVDYKSDNSPLTRADQASHAILAKGLSQLHPDIPILSEEGRDIPYEDRKRWKRFWLVDPLDGTKEFIGKNGEFTVNIALIVDRYPVFGLVYVPAQGIAYLGDIQTGVAHKIGEGGIAEGLAVNRRTAGRIAVRSRSHPSPAETQILNAYGVVRHIAVGSALKFCMVAEGGADVYYRHGPTMEWDTAAGQAVVEAAGGRVLSMPEEERFAYNKEELKNSSFLVTGF